MLRSVVYGGAASNACDDATERYDRAEDAIKTVEWTLAHDPQIGAPLNEAGTIRSVTLDGAQSIGLPTVTVVYEVDAETITIHDMKFEDSKYAAAGRA
jgi:hypothetical protein